MVRFEKMTVKAQEALAKRAGSCCEHENQQIEPVHLLAALVAQADGVVSPLLARLGNSQRDVDRRISNARSAGCRK